MPKRARLVEIQWDARQKTATTVPGGKVVDVDFNPQSLKLNFTNKNAGGDQPGGSNKQFIGAGTTKMTVEMLFDTTRETDPEKFDVRKKTGQVAYFVMIKNPSSKKPSPPGVRFEWGTFIFEGVVDSMDETLDYFAEEGIPLRATVSLSLSRQDIEFQFGEAGKRRGAPDTAGSSTGTPGDRPVDESRPGESVRDVAARNGNSGDWKAIAEANDIDDPLRLPAGTLLDTNVAAGAGAALAAGGAAGASASFGAQVGAEANLGFSAGIGGGGGFSAGAGASADANAGFSAGASAGFGAGASAGFGAGASTGFGAGASAGFGAGAGVGISANAGFSAGASVDADIDFGF